MSDAVLLRVRLAPANDDKVRQASAARAVSIAALMDDAVSRFIFDTTGRLVGLEPLPSEDQQEELHLKSA
ncbi:hypothetical protein [Kineococcus rubinsiae]|uniref:hypothetical protein n=1 Tax=Kineococcus rubinsiae TaxID=2609562 RepID=UPI0014301351|nr:hypothetical protein [Kineococcus rubinsiae]NIZ91730.1 hypothetical protein [Kineococcus rubinsiae]